MHFVIQKVLVRFTVTFVSLFFSDLVKWLLK